MLPSIVGARTRSHLRGNDIHFEECGTVVHKLRHHRGEHAVDSWPGLHCTVPSRKHGCRLTHPGFTLCIYITSVNGWPGLHCTVPSSKHSCRLIHAGLVLCIYLASEAEPGQGFGLIHAGLLSCICCISVAEPGQGCRLIQLCGPGSHLSLQDDGHGVRGRWSACSRSFNQTGQRNPSLLAGAGHIGPLV